MAKKMFNLYGFLSSLAVKFGIATMAFSFYFLFQSFESRFVIFEILFLFSVILIVFGIVLRRKIFRGVRPSDICHQSTEN